MSLVIDSFQCLNTETKIENSHSGCVCGGDDEIVSIYNFFAFTWSRKIMFFFRVEDVFRVEHVGGGGRNNSEYRSFLFSLGCEDFFLEWKI